ncbi:WUSCHEL-related homeobox 14-like [Olea europaea var. sylvestris]|uniref:WUSCHEL-related homeobox 14-like n=1 Tax=Olea europaea var. sylvestris TaxID=158386 RepID=UPI000C1D4816|nr:WUSCHEL-related homeobox 14-like [Olea europaea var. sylvestris]
MEWENQQIVQQLAEEVNNGGIFVKVMTNEQIEILRKQIAVYAFVCEQLVHYHKSLTLQHNLEGVLDQKGSNRLNHQILLNQKWRQMLSPQMRMRQSQRIFSLGTP